MLFVPGSSDLTNLALGENEFDTPALEQKGPLLSAKQYISHHAAV